MNRFNIKDLVKYLKIEKIDFELFGYNKYTCKYIVKNVFTNTKMVFSSDLPKKFTNLFIAIKGQRFDSHFKIKDLTDKCKIFVIENLSFLDNSENLNEFCQNNELIILKAKSTRFLMAYIYKFYYNCIDEKLNIFAITGTDGKTSMVYILSSIFSKIYGNSASIGTLGVNYNGKKLDIDQTTPTTPEIYDLYNIFSQLYKRKTKYVFMEATSIASIQNRLSSISFDSICFTNMTADHLDFHGNLENYYGAKISFIDRIAGSRKKNKTVIYNLDDENKNLVEQRFKNYQNLNILTYGFNKDSDFVISSSEYQQRYFKIKIIISKKLLEKFNYKDNPKDIEIKTSLIGRFNAYNIANSLAHLFNYFVIVKKNGIEKFFELIDKTKEVFLNLNIPGRMQRIKYKNHDIYIDYAHTAAALENAINTLKDVGYSKIITIMGCGGDRDKTKRPIMGKVSTELSDFTILTSDNPRSEEPLNIIKEIEEGISKNNYLIEVNREKAIERAIDFLNKEKDPTALLIAGKGHEDYQEIKGVKYHFNDKEVVEKIIDKSK